MIRIALALMTVCLFCVAAVAKQATQPTGTARVLRVDRGSAERCKHDNNHRHHAGEGWQSPLVISAECRQLDDWRAGRRPLLANYAQYQTRMALENSNLPASPTEVIKGTCAQMRAKGESFTTSITPDVQKRFDEVMKTVKINEMKFLGVLSEDLSCNGFVRNPAQISRKPLCLPPP